MLPVLLIILAQRWLILLTSAAQASTEASFYRSNSIKTGDFPGSVLFHGRYWRSLAFAVRHAAATMEQQTGRWRSTNYSPPSMSAAPFYLFFWSVVTNFFRASDGLMCRGEHDEFFFKPAAAGAFWYTGRYARESWRDQRMLANFVTDHTVLSDYRSLMVHATLQVIFFHRCLSRALVQLVLLF